MEARKETMERGEVEKRNAEEVRRIMEERGYNTKAYQKEQRKGSRDFSVIPKIVAVIVLIGGSIAGGTILIKNVFPDQSNSTLEFDESYGEAQEFKDCINKIDTSELDVTSGDFSSYLKSRYRQQIEYYEKYPQFSDPEETAILQSQLDELDSIEHSDMSDEERQRRYTEINAQHQRSIAKANREYEAAIAKLDAEKAVGDSKSREWLANYDQEKAARDEEYTRQKNERDARETACNNFKTQYGNNATSIADNNSEVKALYAKYQEASNEAQDLRENMSVYTNGCARNASYCNKQAMDMIEEEEKHYSSLAQSYYKQYTNKRQQIIDSYNNQRRQACGY